MDDENSLSNIMETETDMNELRQHLKCTAFVRPETPYEKMVKALKANPFLPLCCAATLSGLVCGLWAFKNGSRKQSQVMMRIRILTQGIAVTAIICGMVFEPKKP